VRRHPDFIDRSLVARAARPDDCDFGFRLGHGLKCRSEVDPTLLSGCSPTYSSATIVTGRSTVTSVCRCSCTTCSPA
jgi:hypothetical protein